MDFTAHFVLFMGLIVQFQLLLPLFTIFLEIFFQFLQKVIHVLIWMFLHV